MRVIVELLPLAMLQWHSVVMFLMVLS